MPHSDVVVDPIELQRQSMAGAAATELELEELCNPTAVKLIIGQAMVNLAQLEALKRQLDRLRDENRTLIDGSHALRVELARSGERDVVSWIEIPVSALLGFSFTLVREETTSGLGWCLLVGAAAILLFLRMSYVMAFVRRHWERE